MAYLETIVRHLEEIFDIKIEGQWNGRTRIEGIRFLACEQDRAGTDIYGTDIWGTGTGLRGAAPLYQ